MCGVTTPSFFLSLFPEHSSSSNGSGKGVMKLHFWFLITQNQTLFEAKQNNREWCQIYKQLEVRVRYSNLLIITVKTSTVKNVSNNEFQYHLIFRDRVLSEEKDYARCSCRNRFHFRIKIK